MENETHQERIERREKEDARLKELGTKYKITGHADTTFVKNGRVFLLETATLGIGIGDIETRQGYMLQNVTTSQPEQGLLVITYQRTGESICLVGPHEILQELQEQIEANTSTSTDLSSMADFAQH